jgi:hypothetical protein
LSNEPPSHARINYAETGTTMSDGIEKPAAADGCPALPLRGTPPPVRQTGGPEGKPEALHNDSAAGGVNHGANPAEDPTEVLKRRLQETCLPPDLKAQILAELPPLAEEEQLFRELQEKGGLSFEQLCASLGMEAKPQP